MERLRRVLASPLRIAVIPADPQDPFGSLGDLAMLTGLRAGLCATYRKVSFTVMAARSQSTTVPGIGHVRTVAAWNGNKGRRVFEKLIRRQDGLFVMGADVLDGKYCDENVQRVVSYCNRAVSDGVPTTILGCSYNKSPSRTSMDALALLHPDVLVNARDNLSLNRLRDFVGAPARLSADIAFLVPPGVQACPLSTPGLPESGQRNVFLWE